MPSKAARIGLVAVSLFVSAEIYSYAATGCILGDANCDGKVDNLDFNIWKQNYLKASANFSDGDFNGDQIVNGVDYALWWKSYGNAATPVPTQAPTPAPTPPPTVTPTAEPTNSPPPPQSASVGVWTSAKELAGKPTSSDAWNQVKKAADGLSSNPTPDLDNQDDNTNTDVLAAAIVYARTGDGTYRTKVLNALHRVEDFTPSGRTLAWARETGAYAIAADLIGYRDPKFVQKMRDMAETYKGSQTNKTLLDMFKNRPNNWGTQAFGSLTAIYSYLGDTSRLREVRDYFLKGVKGEPTSLDFGDLSWQYDTSHPRIINPKGATKNCGGTVNIDGLLPDDMRRGGSCQPDPVYTGYAWEGMQGITMGAYILERAGMSIWSEDDAAICRAASALQDGLFGNKWQASGDDVWQLAFLDHGCGRNWANNYGTSQWSAGKNAGWGYVLN